MLFTKLKSKPLPASEHSWWESNRGKARIGSRLLGFVIDIHGPVRMGRNECTVFLGIPKHISTARCIEAATSVVCDWGDELAGGFQQLLPKGHQHHLSRGKTDEKIIAIGSLQDDQTDRLKDMT